MSHTLRKRTEGIREQSTEECSIFTENINYSIFSFSMGVWNNFITRVMRENCIYQIFRIINNTMSKINDIKNTCYTFWGA